MIRRLEEKDVDYMLEWMHDDTIAANFRVDFKKFTKDDVLKFISSSMTDTDQHFAIVDEHDEYMGTISLKHINHQDHNAEYAISSRMKAHGTGVNATATKELLDYAFHKLGLHKVYLNVLADNIRAAKFYEKAGFVYEGEFKDFICIDGVYKSLKWYGITEDIWNQ